MCVVICGSKDIKLGLNSEVECVVQNMHAHLTFSVVCTSGGDAQRASRTTAEVHTQAELTSPGPLASLPSPVPPLTGTRLLPSR